MNKNASQKFAIWARNELIAQVSQRAYQYGIEESGYGDASADTLNGRLLTAEEKSQRQELIKQIKEKGYKQVMEEVAYTWFNRFIALRFMEVNNYLPSHIRVFSDASGAFKPEILNDVLHLDLPGLDSGKVAAYIESNDTEALYRYLLLTQCNALNEALPVMFERMGGYTEMLLPNNILKQDGVLGRMVSDIPEEDWQDAVQIIGWLYQYYNTELKDDTFAQLKKNVKITKERIPAATQLFTPDWIVRYMVENSLGRLWLEGHPNAELRSGWKYYLDEAQQEPEVETQLAKIREEYKTIRPEDIKVTDPCMGSGHILVYAFDVLMQIYTSAGWDQREAAQSILKNNLYGLDIDDRAAQLAYFAVMMKARQYDRRLFSRGIQPNVYAIRESNGIQTMTIEYFHKNDPKLEADIERIVIEMRDAKEYGSILTITPVDFAGLYARFDEIREDINMMQQAALDELLPLVKCAELLAQKYDVVVTNPPYMSVSNAGAKVNDYVKKNFPDSKSDLFAVFIERCGQMAKKNGYQAMITQHAWMFITSYEGLRKKVAKLCVENLVHLGIKAFEDIGNDIVQTCAFVCKNLTVRNYNATFIRLVECKNFKKKEEAFLSGHFRSINSTSRLERIPGSPIAYWVSNQFIANFVNARRIDEFGEFTGSQNITGDNERFLRYQWEVNFESINKKWIFYAKGGDYRQYYGNLDIVIDWSDSARTFYQTNKTSNLLNSEYWFKEGITYSAITSRGTGFRYLPTGCVFDKGGPSINVTSSLYEILALLNSNVAKYYFAVFNPSVNLQVRDVKNFPLLFNENEKIASMAKENVDLCKEDWDCAETSIGFKRHPLI